MYFLKLFGWVLVALTATAATVLSSATSGATVFGMLEGAPFLVQYGVTGSFGALIVFGVILGCVRGSLMIYAIGWLIIIPSVITSATALNTGLNVAGVQGAKIEKVEEEDWTTRLASSEAEVLRLSEKVTNLEGFMNCEREGGQCPDGSIVTQAGRGADYREYRDQRDAARTELGAAREAVKQAQIEVDRGREIVNAATYGALVWNSFGNTVTLIAEDGATLVEASGVAGVLGLERDKTLIMGTLWVALLFDLIAKLLGLIIVIRLRDIPKEAGAVVAARQGIYDALWHDPAKAPSLTEQEVAVPTEVPQKAKETPKPRTRGKGNKTPSPAPQKRNGTGRASQTARAGNTLHGQGMSRSQAMKTAHKLTKQGFTIS